MRIPACGLVVATVVLAGSGWAAEREQKAGADPQSLTPTRNGPLPPPLPLFPPDNWWNRDVTTWPVDVNSANYINFINNSPNCRRLHPDFGGIYPEAPEIIGFPYIVVDDTPKQSVFFDFSDESDGVDHNNDTPFPFYPIPEQTKTENYWMEGGYPANRCDIGGDRHMLIVDRNTRLLYELYAMCWNVQSQRWEGGSGALFDLKTNARRPEGWTSADAAGLAILPGLVRYEEAFGPSEIDHAIRFTVRSTNRHVYPASHRTCDPDDGDTCAQFALPMGGRLRLKPGVNISGEPAYIQKIFRAMKNYGLIVADNGSDMYISGDHDVRWDSDELNTSFGHLTACDFEVIQLGHNPPPAAPIVSAVSPAAGTTAGGTAIVVGGKNFNTGATVSIGGVPATAVSVQRSTSLTAITPAHAAGPVNVVVTTNGGPGTLTNGYTYCSTGPAAPAITAPASVVVDATNVPASVPNVAGTVYIWSLEGGTIVSGQGTSQIAFNAGPPGAIMTLRVSASAGSCASAASTKIVQVDYIDVPPANPYHDFINTLARNGVTGGCGSGKYCPDSSVTRAQMAIFLLVAKHGAGYVPPPATGTMFADVPATAFGAAYIEQLVREGITGGCTTAPARYCPTNPVARNQMAVFLVVARYGSGFNPPAPTGIFQDVPVTDPYAKWVEKLVADGVTAGCATNPARYCPTDPVTRGQMAVFLVRNFSLP